MKNIAKVFAVILALALILSLAACGGSDNNNGSSKGSGGAKGDSAVVGTWENSEYGIVCTFNENGTGTLNEPDYSVSFTYTDKGSFLEITYDGATDVQHIDYVFEGDNLNLAGITYTKK